MSIAVLSKMWAVAVRTIRTGRFTASILMLPNQLRSFIKGGLIYAAFFIWGLTARLVPHVHLLHSVAQ